MPAITKIPANLSGGQRQVSTFSVVLYNLESRHKPAFVCSLLLAANFLFECPVSAPQSSVKVEVAVLGPRPNEPYGFCGCKATLNHAYALVTVLDPSMSTRYPRTLSSTSSSSYRCLPEAFHDGHQKTCNVQIQIQKTGLITVRVHNLTRRDRKFRDWINPLDMYDDDLVYFSVLCSHAVSSMR